LPRNGKSPSWRKRQKSGESEDKGGNKRESEKAGVILIKSSHKTEEIYGPGNDINRMKPERGITHTMTVATQNRSAGKPNTKASQTNRGEKTLGKKRKKKKQESRKKERKKQQPFPA